MHKIPATGTRAQVWHGTAKHTPGGLTKSSLMKNKHGRIVSRKRHTLAKRENRLVKAGYVTRKGHFGFIRNDKHSRHHKKTRGRKSRRIRGGGLSPLGYSNVGGLEEVHLGSN
jgi:hypothetical protein